MLEEQDKKGKRLLKKVIADLYEYGGYAVFAAKAQLKSEVVNSKLNCVWWVLEPFCFMLVYSFVFGVIFKGREQYHALFVFIGLSLWQFFSKCVKRSVNLVRKRKNIVGRVYLPKYILIIQEILVELFKLAICFVIVLGMICFYQCPIGWKVFLLVPILVELVLLTFGICCFMMHFGVYMTDLSNITDIILKLLVYFTGVFYSITTRVPSPYNEWLLKLNPVALIVESARNAMIYNKPVDYMSLFVWLVVSILLVVLGIRTVYKNENSYIKVI